MNDLWCTCYVRANSGPLIELDFLNRANDFGGISEIFCPKSKIVRNIRGKLLTFFIPVMENYIFIRYTSEDSLINFEKKCSNLLFIIRNPNSNKIINIPDSELETLRDIKSKVVKFNVLDEVIIKSGSLRGLKGVVLGFWIDYVAVKLELFGITRIEFFSKQDLLKS